ncbi:hypothetical protein QYF36_005424 [Acer negundo]|nr:hypothetical protein QYF36_005424 [Acer negundo]
MTEVRVPCNAGDEATSYANNSLLEPTILPSSSPVLSHSVFPSFAIFIAQQITNQLRRSWSVESLFFFVVVRRSSTSLLSPVTILHSLQIATDPSLTASEGESGSLSTHKSGPHGTFVGVYDGHGGPETSLYITDHLFQHLKRFTTEQQSMSVDVIQKAYQATEEGFMSIVTKQWLMKPQVAAVGSCCLVGVICYGTLYIANCGDSRAVLGRVVKATGEVLAIQQSAGRSL